LRAREEQKFGLTKEGPEGKRIGKQKGVRSPEKKMKTQPAPARVNQKIRQKRMSLGQAFEPRGKRRLGGERDFYKAG